MRLIVARRTAQTLARFSKNNLPAIVVGVFATAGILAYVSSRAASPFESAEPEAGTASVQIGIVDDSTASGGRAVKFGSADSAGLKYSTGVSSNGRYFTDQNGMPYSVWGDSPWEIMTRIGPTDALQYVDSRKNYGVNALKFTLVGSAANGFAQNGSTFDGILPFTGGNLNTPNAAYWSRVDNYLGLMRDRGITAFAYAIDGFNSAASGTVFAGKSVTDCYNYGVFLGNRYRDYPNINWMFGGDYTPAAAQDAQFDAVQRGIRSTGSQSKFSIQLNPDKSLSTDSTYWASRVDWNFAYTYNVSYKAVYDGWNAAAKPALYSEMNYENGGGLGTAAELRRNMIWALLAGSPGSFTGQDGVWNFSSDWKGRLDSGTTQQIKKFRIYWDTLSWWTMVPNAQVNLVTVGRTTRITTDDPSYAMDNVYATAGLSADGKLAVVYVPAGRTITLDTTKLAAGYKAQWIDPTNATGTPITATINSSGQVTTPTAAHSDSQTDWLLVIK